MEWSGISNAHTNYESYPDDSAESDLRESKSKRDCVPMNGPAIYRSECWRSVLIVARESAFSSSVSGSPRAPNHPELSPGGKVWVSEVQHRHPIVARTRGVVPRVSCCSKYCQKGAGTTRGDREDRPIAVNQVGRLSEWL